MPVNQLDQARPGTPSPSPGPTPRATPRYDPPITLSTMVHPDLVAAARVGGHGIRVCLHDELRSC